MLCRGLGLEVVEKMTSESEIRRNGKSSRLSALAQPFTVNRPSLRPNSTQFHPLPVSTASTSHINSGSSAYGHDRPPEIQPSSYYKPYPPDAHEPRAAYVIPRDPVSDSLAVAESAQAGYFSGLVSASHESGSVDGLGQGESSFSDSMDFSSLLKQGIVRLPRLLCPSKFSCSLFHSYYLVCIRL